MKWKAVWKKQTFSCFQLKYESIIYNTDFSSHLCLNQERNMYRSSSIYEQKQAFLTPSEALLPMSPNFWHFFDVCMEINEQVFCGLGLMSVKNLLYLEWYCSWLTSIGFVCLLVIVYDRLCNAMLVFYKTFVSLWLKTWIRAAVALLSITKHGRKHTQKRFLIYLSLIY